MSHASIKQSSDKLTQQKTPIFNAGMIGEAGKQQLELLPEEKMAAFAS